MVGNCNFMIISALHKSFMSKNVCILSKWRVGGFISVHTHVSLFFPQQVCAMQFGLLICQGITVIKSLNFIYIWVIKIKKDSIIQYKSVPSQYLTNWIMNIPQ